MPRDLHPLESAMNNAQRYNINDFHGDIPETVAPASASCPRDTQAPKKSRLGAVAWEDIGCDLDADYLVKGVLEAGGMSVVYGESGCGKSFFVLDLACHLALGWEWRGRRVQPAGVIYVAAEGGAGMKRRIAAFRNQHAGKLPDKPGHPGHVPFHLIPTALDLRSQEGDLDELIAEIRAAQKTRHMKAWLLVVDTLSRVFNGGEENGSQDMGAFVRNIDRLRAETGAHVLIVHHAGKDATKGARGHSLLRAAVDTEILIESGRDTGTDGTQPDCPAPSRARVTKQKDGEGAEFGFRLRQVTLGVDQDGDPVTSCVVEETDAPMPKASRLSDRDKLTLEALRTLLIEEGVKLPLGTRFPTAGQQLGVEVSRFRDAFYEKVLSGTQPDTARKAFQRTREHLQASGIIAISGDWVWLPGHRDKAGHFEPVPPDAGMGGSGTSGTPPYGVSRCPVPSRPKPN